MDRIGRRAFLELTAGSATLFAGAAHARSGTGDDPVTSRVLAYARAELAQTGFPGVSLALVGSGDFSVATATGFSDAERRSPATASQLFHIGSITKSLTALLVFALAEGRKIDLAATVQSLLPEHPLPPEPITVRQLLEHSSAMPNSTSGAFPGRRLWTNAAPGTRYCYNNLGYALLGQIAANAAAMPFATLLETMVLRPIGMASAKSAILDRDRDLYALGHSRLRDDRPWLPGARLTIADNSEFHAASGSVGASAEDMVRYLRFVLALGRGWGAPILPDAAAARFIEPTIDRDVPGERYGNGFIHMALEGRPVLRHTGGMTGFSSAFIADPEAGVAAFASVNANNGGGYRPNAIVEYAIALLRAQARGEALPPVQTPRALAPVKNAKRFAANWFASDGAKLAIVERGDWLVVERDGREARLMQAGADMIVTDHTALVPRTLILQKDGALRLGDTLYARDAAPKEQAADPRLAALAGRYQSRTGSADVFAIGNRLFAQTAELKEASDGSWRIDSPPAGGERIWFEDMVGGRPQTLNVSGVRSIRVAT